jgi:hypothetical protein
VYLCNTKYDPRLENDIYASHERLYWRGFEKYQI